MTAFSTPNRLLHYVLLAPAGFACAAAGCCQHTLTIRPLSTDLCVPSAVLVLVGPAGECKVINFRSCSCRKVITSALQEYAGMLVKLLPWTPKKGILEGGGNIGMLWLFLPLEYHKFVCTPLLSLSSSSSRRAFGSGETRFCGLCRCCYRAVCFSVPSRPGELLSAVDVHVWLELEALV